jgi:hypothetical protein
MKKKIYIWKGKFKYLQAEAPRLTPNSEIRDLFYTIVQDTKRTWLSASNDSTRGRGLKLWGVAQQN